jgi:ABC-type sugar transport system substrate-binding protein
MAEAKRIALFLMRKDEAQLSWAATTREEAKRRGFALEERWTEEAVEQNRAIADCVYQGTADALMILPVTTSGPAILLSQAASKGIAVILMNRLTNDLNPAMSWSLPRLRKDFPSVLTIRVAPDEIGIGRVQGQQILTLLPRGGTVIYVQGNMLTSGGIDRTAGLQEVLGGRSIYSVGKVDGGWTSPGAEAALHAWFSLMLINTDYRPRLVVSQSEMMVEGIQRALNKAADQFSRPELRSLPITGCDGMAAFKRAVDEGRLAATVQLPSRAEAAMRVLGDFWTRGLIPSALEILLPASSHPSIEDLSRRAL